jgi:DNA repair exonuclease SbcCD ATPase subunit
VADELESRLREMLAENPGDEIEVYEIVPAVLALQEQVDSLLAEMQERAARHKTALRAAEARAKEAEKNRDACSRDANMSRKAADAQAVRAEQAEATVAAQQETIRALRAALPSTCDSVHHRKADQHEAGEPCPVLTRAEAVLKEQA